MKHTGMRHRGVRWGGYATGAVAVIVVVVLGSRLAATFKDEPKSEQPGAVGLSLAAQMTRPKVSEAGLIDRSGVKIVYVAMTGGGGLIDLRFQVVDPDKAAALHDSATPPAMVDETTGVVVNSLLMGHSHTGAYTTGVTYYLVFENPGNLVQRGTRVSVLLGDAQVQHVLVQ